MSSSRPAQPLRDILENIDAIVDFTTGMTLDVVDETLVWHTIQYDLAPLRVVIVAELSRIDPPAS